MKKITVLFVILFVSISVFSQKRMNEKRVMKEKHINFTEEIIYFNLSGLIEIDGHTFLNDTCKCPIIYYANLDGVTIIDTCTNIKYDHRICGKPGCTIIHLTVQQITLSNWGNQWDIITTPLELQHIED